MRRMRRALYLSNVFEPDFGLAFGGNFWRMRLFLDALQRRFDEVEVLCFVNARLAPSPPQLAAMQAAMRTAWGGRLSLSVAPRAPQPAYATAWEAYGAPLFDLFRQMPYALLAAPEQTEAVRAALARRPACVVARRLPMAALFERAAPSARPPLLFDVDDIEHLLLARSITAPPCRPSRCLQYLRLPAVIGAEMRGLRGAAASFVCSELDRRRLARWPGGGRVQVVSNAVPLAAATSPPTDPQAPTLLLLGNLGYAPNAAAAERLVACIWPRVRARLPHAALVIAGNGADPQCARAWAQARGVEVTGFVADLDALYARSTVVCCPLTVGGGTRVKLIEAAGYGKAMVATTIGAEGLAFRDGHDIVIADDDAAFADACVALLGDAVRRTRLGRAARATAEREYDREAIVARLAAQIEHALATR